MMKSKTLACLMIVLVITFIASSCSLANENGKESFSSSSQDVASTQSTEQSTDIDDNEGSEGSLLPNDSERERIGQLTSSYALFSPENISKLLSERYNMYNWIGFGNGSYSGETVKYEIYLEVYKVYMEDFDCHAAWVRILNDESWLRVDKEYITGEFKDGWQNKNNSANAPFIKAGEGLFEVGDGTQKPDFGTFEGKDELVDEIAEYVKGLCSDTLRVGGAAVYITDFYKWGKGDITAYIFWNDGAVTHIPLFAETDGISSNKDTTWEAGDISEELVNEHKRVKEYAVASFDIP